MLVAKDLQLFIRERLFSEPASQPTPVSISNDAARAAIARIYSRRARAMLKQLAVRSYVWAVTDLLRFRVTSSQAHLRVECEAIALLRMMYERPEIAWRWFSLKDDADGRAFFREHQSDVRKMLRFYELHDTYESASATAQHARFASLVRGLSFVSIEEDARRGVEIRMVVQEFDRDRPESFILQAALTARVQERVFRALLDGMPEAYDPILVEGKLPLYNAMVERLWQLVPSRFPDFFRRWRESVLASSAPS
jgi:hypothetical protein